MSLVDNRFLCLSGGFAITRFFAQLDSVLNSHYVYANAIGSSGDFDASIEFLTNNTSDITYLLANEVNASTYLRIDTSGQIRFRRNNGTSYTVSTMGGYNDGKLHTVYFGIRGTVQYIQVDSDAEVTATVVAFATSFKFAGRSAGGSYFGGILANSILTDNGGVTTTNPLGLATGNSEPSLEANNTITYVFIPDSNREEFTLIDGSWIGQELVVNGGFDTDSDWVKGAGWSISAGMAHHDGAFGNINQDVGAAEGTYKVLTTLTTISGGNCQVDMGGTATSLAQGTSTVNITAVDNDINYSGGSFVGSIDNVSVKRSIEIA